MDDQEIQDIVEMGLLCYAAPCSEKKLLGLFAPTEQVTEAQVQAALHELTRSWQGRALEIHKSTSGWQLRTKPEHKDRLQRFLEATPPRLSRPLTEVLSIVAYHQPVTRGDIENIRGVSTSANQLAVLEGLGWVEVVGRRETPGRPLEYATTGKFLDDLGLVSLADLPDLEEFGEAIAEDPKSDGRSEEITTDHQDPNEQT